MTETSREAFLGAVTGALKNHKKTARPDPATSPSHHRLADLGPEALVDHFLSQAPIRHFTGDRIQTADLAEVLKPILTRPGMNKIVICDDDMTRALDLEEAVKAAGKAPLVYRPEDHDHASLVDLLKDANLGLTVPTYGLADVGAVIEMASRAIPKSFSLLPPVHISLLPLSRLYPSMSQVADVLEDRYQKEGLTSGMNQICGPSSTGDIESYLVTGAHGPVEEHVFIIMDK